MAKQKKIKQNEQVRKLENEELDKIAGGTATDYEYEENESKESDEFEEEQELK